MEEPKLNSYERCQKNMYATIDHYVHTSPVYAAYGFYQLYGHFKSVFLRKMPALVIYVYEENAGIHLIQVTAWLEPMKYLYFIGFEEIKKIYFFLPDAVIFTRIIIKTYTRKYVLGIAKNRNFRYKDSFGNSGHLAFMNKMRELAKTLK